MAFGDMFKKKDKDDFSDFDLDNNTASGSSDSSHMGLPPEGDITNTSPQSDEGFMGSVSPIGQNDSMADPLGNPFDTPPQEGQDYSASSPQAFDELHNLSQNSEKYIQPSVVPKVPSGPIGSGNIIDKINAFEKDFQLINAKLDSIKSFMESINQRLVHIERVVDESGSKQEVVRW